MTPSITIKDHKNKIPVPSKRSKNISNKIKSCLINYFFQETKKWYPPSLTTFLNGFKLCFPSLIHFNWSFILVYLSKSPQRNYWLITFTDSRLCILSSNFKVQNSKSSPSVDAEAVDMYLTSISIHWLECHSTWLPEMQRSPEEFICKLKQFLSRLFWCSVGR